MTTFGNQNYFVGRYLKSNTLINRKTWTAGSRWSLPVGGEVALLSPAEVLGQPAPLGR